MPAFNLTKDLFVKAKIDQSLIRSLKEAAENDRELNTALYALAEILEAENAKDQIEQLKKVLVPIKNHSECHQEEDTQSQLALQYLGHIFFIATSKNPVRRVLVSFFQASTSTIREKVLKPIIEGEIIKILNQPIRNEHNLNGPIRFEESYDLRHDVDTLAALLENFTLGEECLRSHCLPVLKYLTKLQNHFFHTYSIDLSPVQQNETMHNCLETIKLANRICQRSSVAMETMVKDKERVIEIRKVSSQLIEIDICILKSEDFLIDCRTTSAMNMALWMKLLYVQEESFIIKHLLLTVFHRVSSCDLDPLPDRLNSPDLSQLEKSLLPDSSYLCLCYGILAMMPVEILLLEFVNEKCLLLDVLLPEFLQLNKRCKDVGNKLLAAKSICLLSQKLSQYMKSCREDCGIWLLSRCNGESADMTQILDYVWTSWEDSLDAVRFTVKDIFQHVVSIHLYSHKIGNLANKDTFLHKLTKSIIADVSWSCKGKYGTLSVLVSHLGSTRMLELHPGIAADVLLQLKEQTLACYASDLYEKLFSSHMTELSHEHSDWCIRWQPCWIDPVLEVLCGSNKLQKKHVIEYILPKLLKTGPSTLQHIVSKLTGTQGSTVIDKSKGYHLGALIICLRRARALGQLQGLSNRAERRKEKDRKSEAKKNHNNSRNKHAEMGTTQNQSDIAVKSKSDAECVDQSISSSNRLSQSDTRTGNQSEVSEEGSGQSDLWYGVVNVEVLRQALSSRDEQIRLDAFALLCENQKTTEVVSDLELDLITAFIPYNLNNQMPSFRQHFLSHLKKLLSRMKESMAVLRRSFTSTADTEAASGLLKYKEFLVWLKQCLCASLFPGSVFARRTTCLGGLALMMDIYGDSKVQGSSVVEEFNLFEEIDGADIQKLLHCLTDTFEDNKTEAARILIACSNHSTAQGILDKKETENLFEVALTLSSSTRPQDSTTAAYMFKVLIYQPAIFQILNNHRTSQNRKRIENENEAGCQKEATCHTDIPGNESDNLSEMGKDQRCEKNHYNENSIRRPAEDELRITDIGDDLMGRRFLLLVILLKNLKEQASIARNNLIVAAANSPLYPTMQCMRYCLAYIDFRTIPKRLQTSWEWFISEFITLCLDISAVVSPVVHNSSPEGNIPVDAIQAAGLNVSDCSAEELDEKVSRSQETVMLMPEYLVVCCWRSVKEISLILGQLTSDVPVREDGQSLDGLMTHQQVLLSCQPGVTVTSCFVYKILDIGSYFTTQLLESKHRGAFELAYAGFVKVTEMLWRSSVSDLHRLPREWLREVMIDVRSGDPESRLCATRRSAGVPFYVQALVGTEPVSTGRQCFKQTMEELLSLAFSEASVIEENNTSKVHALNILRAMFKDTRLGDDVAPYIADGLKVAILGFKSPLWSVRNSATLLMSAMMVRIFGVKRSKDETSLSRKNCQTGRTFFHRYPSLYQFLLEQLEESTVTMETGGSFHLHPALYPILMVLGHLFPSAMEGTDTALNLAAFIPYVIRCSCSPVLKTRIMAARALQPLVEKDHVTRVFDDLLTLLPTESLQDSKQNQIHGVLLQIKQLLKLVPGLPSSCQDDLRLCLVPKWMEKVAALTDRGNPCLLTRKESLEISATILHTLYPQGSTHITDHMTKVLLTEINCLDTRLERGTPSFVDFEIAICKLSLQCLSSWPRSEISDTVLCETKFRNKDCRESIVKHDMPKENEFLNSKGAGNVTIDFDLETTVLKFLKSPFYEVRKSVLEMIKQCLRQKQVLAFQTDSCDHGDVLDDCDNALPSLRDELLCIVVNNSVKIFEELITMAFDRETHHECLTEVFGTLECHSFNQDQMMMKNYSVEELLSKVVRKGNSLTRDEVLTALIGYSGHLVTSLSQEITRLQKGSILNRADQIQKKLALIEEWACLIQSHCGTEQNVDKQTACITVIANKANFLLCDSNKILGNLTFIFWKILIDLVQEDDLEVKDIAAGILSGLDPSIKAPVHPYLALDILIGQLFHHHGNSKMVDCMHNLIGWMVESNDNEDIEERLFDRGEMNTYSEPIDFIQLLDKHLIRFLSTSLNITGEPPGETTISSQLTGEKRTHKASIENENLPEKYKTMDLNERVSVSDFLFKTIERLEPALNSLRMLDSRTGYLNANTFNRNMVDIYRIYTLLKYANIFAVSERNRKKFDEVRKTMDEICSHNPHIESLLKPLIGR